METIARHIVTSSGPSGTNREYLYQLASAVRDLLVMEYDPNGCDHHLFELENLVRGLEQGKSQPVLVDGQHDASK